MLRITKDNDISELQAEKDVLKNAVTNAVGVKDYIKKTFLPSNLVVRVGKN